MINGDQQRITQHKRFVLYSTHPNFCFAKTSFMLGTLWASLIKRHSGHGQTREPPKKYFDSS